MNSPVIFLDMDGVLSTARAWIAQAGRELPDRWIDRVAVRLLNLLCDETDAVIVVSSTWRLNSTAPEFLDILTRNGFTGRLHADWRTERLNTQRGHEIAEWLARHPETPRYVILDDNSDMLEGQHFVLTDGYNGLLFEHYHKALRILQGLPPRLLL